MSSIPIARSTSSSDTPGGHIAGLDGIRALAVLLVVFYHLNLLGIGWVGVQFFFVLSGFLITRLLLELRAGRTLGPYLKIFFGRRVLRIFPLYYLFLLIALVASATVAKSQGPAVSGQWGYAATYLYNWWGMTRFHEKTWFLDHLWSLAIEEQFYLVWPFLVFWLAERRLLAVLLALVAAGPVIRFCIYLAWPQLAIADPGTIAYAIGVCTLSQLDAFALGASLCFLGDGAAGMRGRGWWLGAAVAAAWLLGSLASGAGWAPLRPLGAPLTLGYPNTLAAGFQFVWGYSAINAVGALLIALVAYGNFGGGFFRHPWIEYLGRISYGIYIWHFPLAHFTSPWVYEIHRLTGANFYVCLMIFAPFYLALLLAISAISYAGYERRFLALKQRWFSS